MADGKVKILKKKHQRLQSLDFIKLSKPIAQINYIYNPCDVQFFLNGKIRLSLLALFIFVLGKVRPCWSASSMSLS